jgi:hypothetical protein
MTDPAGLEPPRFPESCVADVAARLGMAIDRFRDRPGVAGFAGLARGGDILFHEACWARGIDSHVILPFAEELFVETSVRSPGTDWEERFWSIWNAADGRREVLGLPIADRSYQICNHRLLRAAQAHGEIALVAIYADDVNTKPGGAGDLIAEAASLAVTSVIIRPIEPDC